MKQSTIERLRRKLLARRNELLDEVDSIRANSLSRRDKNSGDVSAMPIHMADVGSDNYEREFAVDFIEGGQEELREIDTALERIAEGTYGLCEECGGRVRYSRLSALPSARLCIECKRKEEEAGE